ncbi:hypothetical protein Pfo_002659, partial [Paulownia fortunei]
GEGKSWQDEGDSQLNSCPNQILEVIRSCIPSAPIEFIPRFFLYSTQFFVLNVQNLLSPAQASHPQNSYAMVCKLLPSMLGLRVGMTTDIVVLSRSQLST